VGEVHRADPKTLRIAGVIIGVGVVAGALLILAAERLEPFFTTWVSQDLHVRSRVVFSALTALTVGPTLAVSGYCWRLGQRIVDEERYPPAGLRVIRDMPVLTGGTARGRGRLLQAFGVAAAVAVLMMAFFMWRVLLEALRQVPAK
jgi:hypothetical protein